jgi:hypothetical protein
VLERRFFVPERNGHRLSVVPSPAFF